ncbi:MAG: hypothetical protein CYPHOPRED_004869, partial [Cyphobasidiales sp. Tagirdzhanova-0007]
FLAKSTLGYACDSSTCFCFFHIHSALPSALQHCGLLGYSASIRSPASGCCCFARKWSRHNRRTVPSRSQNVYGHHRVLYVNVRPQWCRWRAPGVLQDGEASAIARI